MGAAHEVRWDTASQGVSRKHTCETPVLDACNMRVAADGVTGPFSSLAVLESQTVTMLSQSGVAHSILLPCKPRAMWPMLPGILVEPAATATGAAGSPAQSDASSTQVLTAESPNAGAAAPSLVLLRRPLDNPAAVALLGADPAAGGVAFGHVLVAAEQLVLTYDAAGQRHALWRIGADPAGTQAAAPVAATDLAEGEGSLTESGLALFPVWAQPTGSAPAASTCCFFSRCLGLLYLLQARRAGCTLATPLNAWH